jgi:2',3'-cyclic-nucleotide 2'-phosphodiesterase (5'-nucleotidase family)
MLVLDAGNSLLNAGDPAERTHGQTSVEAMNLMGYDAMALGSLDVSKLTPDQLRQRMQEADFAMLSANVYDVTTQELLTDPYTVIEMADHRVGILGLTDEGFSDYVAMTDPVEAAEKWLPELQGQADIIIVLSHAGLEIDQEIAKRFSGIDLIVSGRNVAIKGPHVSPGTGTVILHADAPTPGNAGKNVGVTRLNFDESGNLVKHEWSKVLLNSDFDEDPEILAWLESLYATLPE